MGTDALPWVMFIDLVNELVAEPKSHTRLYLTDEDFPLDRGMAHIIMLVGALARVKEKDLLKLLPRKKKADEISRAERDAAHAEMLEYWGLNTDGTRKG